ncbi:MAG: MBL fold metallo-hydrolase [Flavitalea sp.]
MKRYIPVILVLAFSLMNSSELHAQLFKRRVNKSVNFTIEQLAPRVWAAIQNDFYGKAICNAGIIDLGNKTLVFDPFLSPSAARELNIIAKQLTHKPVSIVVNSNYHNDHIRGNQVFLPNASIMSTSITREEMERIEPEEQAWEKAYAPTLLEAVHKRSINSNATDRDEMPYWVGYYEALVESSDELFLALPDVVFDDSLWIMGSKLSVQLVERKNGNTISDAVLLIPKYGIAFMGDLLCNERHPWMSDGNVHGWRQSLKTYYEDTLYTTYLPGHGKVAGKAALRSLYEYLGDVQALCDAAQTDSAQSALLLQPIPAAYRGWYFGRFYQPNLQYLLSLSKQKTQGTLKTVSKQ